jgi:hypothetical protein
VTDKAKAAMATTAKAADTDSCLLTAILLGASYIVQVRYCNAAFVSNCREVRAWMRAVAPLL